MRKNIKSIVVTMMCLAMMGVLLTGCGVSQQDVKQDISKEKEHVIFETKTEEITRTEAIEEKNKTEETENTAQVTNGYEDNFAVDSKAARDFAKKVKEVTAKKDLNG